MPSVLAEPTPFSRDPRRAALLIIDMQRDFLEPGGFGEALGNDVAQLRPAIAPLVALLAAARVAGLRMIHTREGHRPDLGDLHESKRLRGRGGLTIGDEGPMGRILVIVQPGLTPLIVCGVTTEVCVTPPCARSTAAGLTAWFWPTAPRRTFPSSTPRR